MTTNKQKSSSKANFIHLRVHSSYSLSKGAIKIEDLKDLCHKNKMPAVALTDSSNLFGSLEFAKKMSDNSIQPIIGCVVNIDDGEDDVGKLVLLAKDDEGYQNLLKIVSNSFLNAEDSHKPTVKFADLEDSSSGIIALTGGHQGLIDQHLANGNKVKAEKTLETFKKLFPECLYVELSRHGLKEEKAKEKGLIDLAYKNDLPLVATNDVYFASPDIYEAHDALICIADGTYVSTIDRRRFTAEHYFKSAEEMAELFADIPEAIENTVVIAQRCGVMPEAHDPMLPHFPTEDNRSEEDELRELSTNNLKERLEHSVFKEGMSESEKEELGKPYFERLDYELSVINRMKFPGYFLIVSDFIIWSKKNDIPVGPGRGSGAGSVVAWALQITNLDPLRFGLLFERFLNPERVSMPDFDIDFCQERRDEVIKYVQEKYGTDRVAQIITFGKLQARAVLRDVGRVLQLPYNQVDAICKMIPFNPIAPVTLSQAIEMDPQLRKEEKQDEQVAKLLDIGLKLEGLHRHASTHAAGVVIASKPLLKIAPLYSDNSNSSIPTTQYSMKYAEMAGLVKFDFLGLKTLTVISHACKLIRAQGGEIDIDNIPLDDEKTFKMLTDGASTGVFQMESAGMRDALRKMRPDSIEDIIALISLYRPGPMENIPTYINRKHGKEKPDYLHPMLEDILKETFGVIIYQEQVMQIAQVLAGYSLGGADLLRRAMGKKIKEEMDAQRDMFVEGAVKNGVEKRHASGIFDLVAKFAGYGFNKSHAAAYAVIGYQTAYLKANYPVEFLTASMNIDIGDTDKLNVFKDEAVISGIKILPPGINMSDAIFTVEQSGEEKAIRYGLGALKSVGLVAMEEMVEERNKQGEFKDIFDFANKCSSKVINKRQLESLTKSGALDSLAADKEAPNRRQLFESASTITRYNQAQTLERESNQTNLFGEEQSAPVSILANVEDWTREERLANEFDAIGFYLNDHPLDNYKNDLNRIGVVFANELNEKIPDSGGTRKVAGMVSRVVHRSSANRRFSYLYISDPTGSIEISLFNEDLISESREILESNKPILITVDARRDDGGIRLQAENIVLLDEFLENRQYGVHLFIEQDENKNHSVVSKLKDMFDGLNKGGANIYLTVTTSNNMNVEIKLPNSYAINHRSIEMISSLEGISKVIAD